MNSLSECIEYYYTKENYNCAEAVIRGANDFYGLDIGKEDMKMFGGYGAGIYAGLVCGALIAGAAVLSVVIGRRTSSTPPSSALVGAELVRRAEVFVCGYNSTMSAAGHKDG